MFLNHTGFFIKVKLFNNYESFETEKIKNSIFQLERQKLQIKFEMNFISKIR